MKLRWTEVEGGRPEGGPGVGGAVSIPTPCSLLSKEPPPSTNRGPELGSARTLAAQILGQKL